MNKLEAALKYASWGWHVLPVIPNGKTPACQGGVNSATVDTNQIRRWWSENPEYNIGVAAGKHSGVIVFDVDPRNGGKESWDQFLYENGRNCLDSAFVQLTAGGGYHYLAEYDERISSCKLDNGIDLLSDGRYFIAYPSVIHDSGYEWESDADPFDIDTNGCAPFQIPTVWLSAIIERKNISNNPLKSGEIIKGNRNSGLTSLAGAMRNWGLGESEILAALYVLNENRVVPPLPTSEVKQIANSVCRYEIVEDIAASVAHGKNVADAILEAAARKKRTDYFLTQATKLIGQPAPINWIVKHHIPSGSSGAIYGESGIGKTFVAIDMACCIAAGKDWANVKTKPGVVIYLAGEGNYGLRQRMAAWAKYNQVDGLENLFISNKAIDLDAAGASAEIIRAIKEVCNIEDVSMVIIDTLNRHMSGEENNAKDFRAMMSACDVVALATGASTVFVHHVGHGENAKNRMRGSSAMKASLDFMIFVSGENEKIKVSWEKMKDARHPDPLYFEFKEIDLGWIDEDGEPEPMAAVVVPCEDSGPHGNQDAKNPENDEDRVEKVFKRVFEKAWYRDPQAVHMKPTGQVVPLISRAMLVEILDEYGDSERTIKNKLTPSRKGSLVNVMIEHKIIEQYKKDWAVINPAYASAMMIVFNSTEKNTRKMRVI